ncbi:DUF4440 domain-containing protein [uncultured Shewanella sp.]|uniref:nuclear transport factor 2 family protein n=1 Tax=uncultured Shewanella sp. TaxID=173975 RepID=UPI002623DE34|nr:DUF4440 domain-containing protein [uncultured Shewanella sp.]
MEHVIETLITLEKACIQADIRASKSALADLIDDDFIEIPCSGIPFNKASALSRIPNELPPKFTQQDYALTMLAPNVALLTYQASITKERGSQVSYSMRSSIWRFKVGRWRMCFHQGTPIGTPISTLKND